MFHFLLLCWPLLSFAWRRDYPVTSAEIALLAAGLLAATALLTLAIRLFDRPAALLLTPAAITLVSLVQFNPPVPGALAVLVISAAVMWWLRQRVYTLGLPVLAAFLLGAWLDSAPDDGRVIRETRIMAINEGLPPVLHILLDSFSGLDGLPDYPATEVIRGETERFFSRHGFQVYPRAYSRHATTGDSMYAGLNFSNDGNSPFFLEVSQGRQHVLGENALFDRLQRLGYRLNIYQTQHLDFCQSHPAMVDRCWSYAHPNVDTVRAVDGAGQRAVMLAKVILSQSGVLTEAVKTWMVDPAIAVHDPAVLDELAADVLAAPDGRAFFAHLLLPHGPFAYLHDCQVDYATDPRIRHAFLNSDGDLDPAIYEYRAMKYFEQTECALNSLEALFAKLAGAGIFERAVIVLHGDHGSMIGRTYPIYWNREKLTPVDYRAFYSVLFATRFPAAVAPPGGATEHFGAREQPFALSELLGAFADDLVWQVKSREQGSVTGAPSPSKHPPGVPFIYLVGPPPQQRVDINIFEP